MPVKGGYIDIIPGGAPSGVEGRIYYDSSARKLYYHNGSEWVEIAGGAKIQVTEFTSSGIYNTPSGAKMLIVYIAGAGGGGFGGGGFADAPGGAGGSLTIAIINNPASSYAVTVGAGGAGGSGGAGAKGGDSAFGSIYATGGGEATSATSPGTATEYYQHPDTVAPTTTGTFYLSYRGCNGGEPGSSGESGFGHSGGTGTTGGTHNSGGGGAGPFGNGGDAPGGAGEITAGGAGHTVGTGGSGGNGKVVVVAVI